MKNMMTGMSMMLWEMNKMILEERNKTVLEGMSKKTLVENNMLSLVRRLLTVLNMKELLQNMWMVKKSLGKRKKNQYF